MRNEPLLFITKGYEPIAQMSLSLAETLGYLQPEFSIVSPQGDVSSAGLPYFIDGIVPHEDCYHFPNFMNDGFVLVSPDFQVLVYRKPFDVLVSELDAWFDEMLIPETYTTEELEEIASWV